ncbi:hypothetical protein [Streptomyces sp. NPDC001999]
MAKAPAVIGVLTEPAPPTWWKANRYKVFLVLGLIGGFYLGTHTAPVDPSTAAICDPLTEPPVYNRTLLRRTLPENVTLVGLRQDRMLNEAFATGDPLKRRLPGAHRETAQVAGALRAR